VGRFNIGSLKIDLLALTEWSMPPFYDLSLGGVLNYSIGDGILELGCGFNFKRLIPLFNTKSETREHRDNAYLKILNTDMYTGYAYYTERRSYYSDKAADLAAAGDSGSADQMQIRAAGYRKDEAIIREANSVIRDWDDFRATGSTSDTNIYSAELAAVNALIPGATGSTLDSLNKLAYIYQNVRGYDGYYSASGVIVMARASFNIGKLLNLDAVQHGKFKVFGEAAMLGVKDYPVFYEKPEERIPVMMGVNLPGFMILDNITIQAEVWRSRVLNSLERKKDMNNVPGIPKARYEYYSKDDYGDITERDDIKWSLLLQKNLGILTISTQLARDHMRLVHDSFLFGPGLESGVVTANEKSWYWTFQLAMGI
jgi:hypothetical protein